MAVLDEATQKIVVRIVYDGPVRAGKSTNLKQLCRGLTPLRRSELFVPGEVSGRTLFFDWLQLDAGVVGGRHLRCQFVTVPGQTVLHRRRRILLEAADAIVLVCESTVEGARKGREALGSMREYLDTCGSGDTPIVLQANKQDLPGALTVERLAAALALPAEVPTVAAAAESGLGVRETAVLAIRAAANRVQSTLLALGADALRGNAETGEELYHAMLDVEAMLPQSPSETLRALSQRGNDQSTATASTTDGANRTSDDGDAPDFPVPEAPSGTIWPTPEGRGILRALEKERPKRREDLTGQPGASDGSGRSDAFIYEAGPWCMKTSSRRRYHRAQEARSALLQLVRSKLRLGALLAPRTVLCLGPETARGQWLWTITPWVTTLRAEMAEADAAGDQAALGGALVEFARTAVAALALAARQGLILDVHPSNFARAEGRIVYLDDDIGSASAIPAIGYNLLQRVEEYAHHPAAIGQYVEIVESAIRDQLSREEAERLELEPALEQAVLRSEEAREAQRRLRGLVSRSTFAIREH